jgi:hypothetical protein
MSRLLNKRTVKYQRLFSPLGRAEEIDILLNDDDEFNATKLYLDSLIMDALSRFQLSDEQLTQLHRQLLDDIPIAARRFLGSEKSMSADYQFCTYFTWYIAERVNKRLGKSNLVKSADNENSN